jgi:hypothetical protein
VTSAASSAGDVCQLVVSLGLRMRVRRLDVSVKTHGRLGTFYVRNQATSVVTRGCGTGILVVSWMLEMIYIECMCVYIEAFGLIF